MKFQPSSRREIRRVAAGTGILSTVMLALLLVLHLMGMGSFDLAALAGAAGGALVAITNFTILCLTIQQAAATEVEAKRMVLMRRSYCGRLLLQAAWIMVAFSSGHIHMMAAALPLLFPHLTIFYLNRKPPDCNP